MGATVEADDTQCEGSLQPPITQTGRWALCAKCGGREEVCSDGQGNVVLMPHVKGENTGE